MFATNTPSHPTNSGRGKQKECPARRPVDAPLVDGPRAQLLEIHRWKVDCALNPGHKGLHTDPSGQYWNDQGVIVDLDPTKEPLA
jgi:hypothetical protein